MEIICHVQNNIYNASLRGKFTFADNSAFRPVIESMTDPAISQVALNLSGVDFVDSAAMGMLMLAHDEAQKNNKTFRLHGVAGNVKRIFDLARLDQLFMYE